MDERALYREEIFAAQMQKNVGRVRPGLRRLPILLTLLLLAICVLVGVFLRSGNYARKVTVSGYLTPIQPSVKVRLNEPSATIFSVHVREGDYVQAGQRLLTVGDQVGLQSGRSLDEQIGLEFKIQALNLSRERSVLRDRHHSTRTGALQSLDRLTTYLEGLRHASGLRTQRLQLADSKSHAMKALVDDRVISDMDWINHQSAVLQIREAVLSLDNNILKVLQERGDRLVRLQELDVEYAHQLLQLDNRRSILQQSSVRAHASAEHIIVAPDSGYVDALLIHEGVVARAGMTLLVIVAENRTLKARLMIPSHAAGFVETGQVVKLMVDAFPYQHFGTHRAVLSNVSSSLVAQRETVLPIVLAEASYTADALLGSQRIEAYGKHYPLREGMRLKADIVLEQRSILDWVLQPLLALKGRTS